MTTFAGNVWDVVRGMAPWLFLGALVAGALHVLLPADFVSRHLGRSGWRDVLYAALFGVPMPLCSCAVIPVTLGLRKDGASAGAAVSFLISTPQTGVDSILVSATFLGWPFALFKVVCAFVTGLVGGLLVNLTAPRGAPSPDAAPPPVPAVRPRLERRVWVWEAVRFGVDELLHGIWRWLLIGVLVSAAISTFVPANALVGQRWSTGLPGMLVMLAVALPMYVCATGSVPIAASLVAGGMDPGTALVFLMAGPASNAATIGAVYRTFGARIVAIYLGVVSTASVLAGWLLGTLLARTDAPGACHGADTGLLTTVCGLGFGLMLLSFAARDAWTWWTARRRPAAVGATVRLRVTGMTCDGCAGHVRRALLGQPGVSRVDVDLASGLVSVTGEDLAPDRLAAAVVEVGYGAAPVPAADGCGCAGNGPRP